MKNKSITLSIILILLQFSSFSQQTWNESEKLLPSDRLNLRFFGNAVSTSGDFAIIGEYQSEPLGSQLDYGAAYIYKRQVNGNWIQVKKLEAVQKENYDQFGNAVYIDSSWIAVGCFKDNQDENEAKDSVDAGSVYLYKLDATNQWIYSQKIVASDRSKSAFFGTSVHISGRYMIIGASNDGMDSIGGSDFKEKAGSAYIFYLNNSGKWEQVQKLVSLDRNSIEKFGQSVHISDNIALVGAPSNGVIASGDPVNASGSFYIFEKQPNGMWTQTQELYASDQESSGDFGYSLDRSGDLIIVGAREHRKDAVGQNSLQGAGACFFYSRNLNGQWSFIQKVVSPEREEDDGFGTSVAIEDSIAVIGAPYWGKNYSEDSSWRWAGATYIYKYSGTWDYSQTIRAFDIDELERFGNSVDIQDKQLLIGAPGDHIVGPNYKFAHAGAAYAFKLCDATSFNITKSGTNLISGLSGGTYQWLDCNNKYKAIENATGQSYRPMSPGSVAVRVVHDGCVDTSTCFTYSLGVETILQDKIKLFPNPSTGTFILKSNLIIDRVVVFDAMGRVVEEFNKQDNYKLSNAASGLYFVKVFSVNGTTTLRLELE